MAEASSDKSSRIEEFKFLNFTNFNHTRSPETKKKVRSHAQHRVQQHLRSEGRKRKGQHEEIVLDTSALKLVPHPSDLGAGRSDPFRRYPISMNTRAHELLDHLHGDTCSMFKTMSKLGFFQIIEDQAGFRQILSTSSCHEARLRNEAEPLEAVALSTAAIQSVSDRLTHPVLSTSDGIVITLIAITCHAVMFHDIRGLVMHFNGLEQVIKQRSGSTGLLANSIVRIMLFWLDVNTAFILNRAPRFPCPSDVLPDTHLEILPSISRRLLQMCSTKDMINAVDSLYAINWLITSQLGTRNVWDDGLFAGFHVMPLLYRLLELDLGSGQYDPPLLKEQTCRIGVILYLAAVRRQFGVSLATDVFIPKLRGTIENWQPSDMVGMEPPLLWVVMICGMQSFHHAEHWWFVSKTAVLISAIAYDSWQSVMELISQILWIPGILEVECEEFHVEVSAAFSALNNHVLL